MLSYASFSSVPEVATFAGFGVEGYSDIALIVQA